MQKRTFLCSLPIVLITAVLLCLPASTALATNATEIKVGGFTLNASNPYWRNGGGAGTENDWNIFFDTSTSVPTLRMKNAEVHTTNNVGRFISVDGDINLELLGNSNVGATLNTYPWPGGIIVDGSLTVFDGTGNGTGSLTIDITHLYSGSYYVDGIDSNNPITIQSGTIHITLIDYKLAYGIWNHDLFIMNGGKITIDSRAATVLAVETDQFTMTGGVLLVTTHAVEDDSNALYFRNALVTGGEGLFVSAGSGYALTWEIPDPDNYSFLVMGGHLVFSNTNAALRFMTTSSLTPVPTGQILVSTAGSGDGKTEWKAAMGSLADTDIVGSNYRYVEFLSGAVNYPQTGDAFNPWMWLGAGLGALCAAGSFLLRKRRKA